MLDIAFIARLDFLASRVTDTRGKPQFTPTAEAPFRLAPEKDKEAATISELPQPTVDVTVDSGPKS